MKKSLSILTIIAILVVSMFAMVGCGGDESEVLIVGTEPTYAPFESTDDDGNIVGFDVDLMTAIAEDQGLTIKFQAFEFDSLVPGIGSDSMDIIAAGMNVTPDRAKKVDFTDVYYEATKTILVKADNTTINTIDDFTKDMKIAVQIGTYEADYAQQMVADGKLKEAVVLNQTTQCIMQLQNGDVDAVMLDTPVANNYLSKNADSLKALAEQLEPEDATMAFAVKKGNTELLEKLNAGLKNVVDSGKYDDLVAKWFE